MEYAVRVNPNAPPRVYTETEPIFLAAHKNDLQTVKSLIESGENINKKSPFNGDTLLHRAIRLHNRQLLDYLLSRGDIDVNVESTSGGTPLLFLVLYFDVEILMKFINKGAKIDARDEHGNSFLHLLMLKTTNIRKALETAQIFLRLHRDLIDAQNDAGETPIYLSIKYKMHAWTWMLLYYGADVTIPCSEAILPLVSKIHFSFGANIKDDEETLEIRNIVLNLTFNDTDLEEISLNTLITGMSLDPNIFEALLNHTKRINYKNQDFEHVTHTLCGVKAVNFKLFVERFRGDALKLFAVCSGHFLSDFLEHVRVCYYYKPDFVEILYCIFENDLTKKLVETCNDSYSVVFALIHTLVLDKDRVIENYNLEVATEIICVFLSQGLKNVTSDDLDIVYKYFGDCDLFRILLGMDFVLKSEPENWLLTNQRPVMSCLCYNPMIDLDTILDDYDKYSVLESALDYHVNPRLNKLCLNQNRSEIIQKINNLPSVPFLIELSRNAARKCVIDRFEIDNCKDFYRVLRLLPIGDENKKLLT